MHEFVSLADDPKRGSISVVNHHRGVDVGHRQEGDALEA